LPDLALGAASVGGRIEQDDIVTVATAGLAFGKLYRIFANPSDWTIRKTGHLLVFPCPADCLFRRVDMRYLGACARSHQRSKPGVAKEVQNLHGSARGLD